MSSTPRPIFFSTELEAPPIKDFAINKSTVRRLFNDLHEPGGYPYENLAMQGTRPKLSTSRGDDAQSCCEIGQYTVKIEEHNPEMPVDEFVGVAKTVLTTLGEDCPLFFVQRCKINCLMQTSHVKPLEMLASRIANVGGEKIFPFGRVPRFFGVRFRFGPYDPADYDDEEDEEVGDEDDSGDPADASVDDGASHVSESVDSSSAEKPSHESADSGQPVEGSDDDLPAEIEAPEHLRKFGEAQGGHYTVRFEPFSEDPSQVWIEVSSVFSAMRGPFTVEHFSAIGKNITETCEFAIKRCKTFLEQFDTPGGTND